MREGRTCKLPYPMQLLYETWGLGEKCVGGCTLCSSKFSGCAHLEATHSSTKIFQVQPIQQENKKEPEEDFCQGAHVRRPASLPLPAAPALPLLSRKRPPHSPYVTHPLPEHTDAITLGLGAARGQHRLPSSPALLSVAGEITDPQLLQSQPTETGSRDKSGCSRRGRQTGGYTKAAGAALARKIFKRV